jgi:hypothetical protein
MKPSATPLDRLALLSTQRTARTDRVHEAACALLSQLAALVPVGTTVRIDGWQLRRSRTRTNVGEVLGWAFGSDGGEDWPVEPCDLDSPVNGEGYWHGDFRSAWRGPSRTELVAFATRAQAFVGALITREETIARELDAAETAIGAARVPASVPS